MEPLYPPDQLGAMTAVGIGRGGEMLLRTKVKGRSGNSVEGKLLPVPGLKSPSTTPATRSKRENRLCHFTPSRTASVLDQSLISSWIF